MNDLKNRIALVTGASRGIGAGIALGLARAGANVAVNYRERADAAQQVCAGIRALGRNALAVQADVSVAAEVTRMVTEIERELGPVDVLVNNAGIAIPANSKTSLNPSGTWCSTSTSSRCSWSPRRSSAACASANGDASL